MSTALRQRPWQYYQGKAQATLLMTQILHVGDPMQRWMGVLRALGKALEDFDHAIYHHTRSKGITRAELLDERSWCEQALRWWEDEGLGWCHGYAFDVAAQAYNDEELGEQ